MVPVTVEIDGEYSSYYYTMIDYVTGLENPAKYPDPMLYETLVYYGVYYAEKVNFRAPWNKTVLLAAMAIDKEGRYSRVFRQKCQFKKYQATDINDFFTKSSTAEAGVTIPFRYDEPELKVIKNDFKGDSRYSLENIARIRKENRRRRF